MCDSTLYFKTRLLQSDDIRLIRLLPGEWNDPIRCELRKSVLSKTPKYYALSYAWGSKKVTRSVIVDGRPVQATVNLEGALRHLRLLTKNGVSLWVDALCINQGDVEERTNQVQLMGRIYESCVSVLVYLGPGLGSSRTKRSVPCIRRFFHDARDNPMFERFNQAQSIDSSEPFNTTVDVFSLIRALAEGKHFSDSWLFRPDASAQRVTLIETLRRMMQPPFTPWWTRIWVVQEVTLPKEVLVVCGPVSAPWSVFAQAAAELTRHSVSCCSHIMKELPRDEARVFQEFSNRIKDIDVLRLAQAKTRVPTGLPTDSMSVFGGHWRSNAEDEFAAIRDRKSLLGLLQRFRNRKASDPRDKIYALLSMVESSEGSKLVPDYSLSERAVFMNATLEIIRVSKSLSVLSAAIGRKFRNDLPTWVPDWDAPVDEMNDIRSETVDLYKAPTSSEGFAMPKLMGASIKVRAWRICHATMFSEVMWGDSASVFRKTVGSWEKALEAQKWWCFGPAVQCSNFGAMLYADIIHSLSNGKVGVHRATPSHELDFVLWAEISPKSPFKRGEEAEAAPVSTVISYPARLWRFWWLIGLLGHSGVSLNETAKHITPQTTGILLENIQRAHVDLREVILPLPKEMRVQDDFVILMDETERQICQPVRWQVFMFRSHEILCSHFGEKYSGGLGSDQIDKRVAEMDTSIMAATLSRRLFFTSRGNMGLGPPDAKYGDTVWIIEGGKTPFVLNRWPVAAGTYRIVGDCYLQGLMDLGGVDPGKLSAKWEDIYLE